jgi:hypothetical protein
MISTDFTGHYEKCCANLSWFVQTGFRLVHKSSPADEYSGTVADGFRSLHLTCTCPRKLACYMPDNIVSNPFKARFLMGSTIIPIDLHFNLRVCRAAQE